MRTFKFPKTGGYLKATTAEANDLSLKTSSELENFIK